MALAGFDVFTIVTTSLILGIYQLFTHSRVIGKLGILEYFLTTPLIIEFIMVEMKSIWIKIMLTYLFFGIDYLALLRAKKRSLIMALPLVLLIQVLIMQPFHTGEI